MILALDEACANVIRHAFPGDQDGCFRLVAEITDDDVRMSVEDDGVGIPRDRIDLRDGAGHDSLSGRGLDIIRHVMTSVEVRSPAENGAGTQLVMTKRLREPV